MAHPEQKAFCKSVKQKYPFHFKDPSVLDVGSLDINGNNRYLFEGHFVEYIGLDVGEGDNVDVVCPAHFYNPKREFDVIISTECFEHDMHWVHSLRNCIRLLKHGGLFLFTCATTGRNEHGTTRTTPQDSPFTYSLFNNYYMNLTEEDIRTSFSPEEEFSMFKFSTNKYTKDLYFYGIKKNLEN